VKCWHLKSVYNDNINMVLTEIMCEDVVWIHQARDRIQLRALVNMVMNLRVP